MAVIAHNAAEVELLARLMRAEAEGDGTEGMLMVGNVGVNRVLGDCLDFTDIRTLQQMVFQSPGGFEATTKGLFLSTGATARYRSCQASSRGRTFSSR